MEIVLYGMGRPSRTFRVAWALEEAGAPYELRSTGLADPAFLAVNPMGKVPALVVDGRVLTESGACCAWVADAFPESELAPPPRSWERAQCDRWSQFVLTELEQPCWLKAKHVFALPERLRCPEVKPAAAWEFQRAAAVLETALDGGQHLVGDGFTVADLLAVHTVVWAQRAGFEVSPTLTAYAGVHGARPAFQRAMVRELGGS